MNITQKHPMLVTAALLALCALIVTSPSVVAGVDAKIKGSLKPPQAFVTATAMTGAASPTELLQVAQGKGVVITDLIVSRAGTNGAQTGIQLMATDAAGQDEPLFEFNLPDHTLDNPASVIDLKFSTGIFVPAGRTIRVFPNTNPNIQVFVNLNGYAVKSRNLRSWKGRRGPVTGLGAPPPCRREHFFSAFFRIATRNRVLGASHERTGPRSATSNGEDR